jgi:Tol biopolymer transport system component
MSTRSGTEQIWSMLADGTHARQLTHDGRNRSPAWSR